MCQNILMKNQCTIRLKNTYEIVIGWNHNIHFGRLSRDNFSVERILAQEHLASISFIDGNRRNFAQNLEWKKGRLDHFYWDRLILQKIKQKFSPILTKKLRRRRAIFQSELSVTNRIEIWCKKQSNTLIEKLQFSWNFPNQVCY